VHVAQVWPLLCLHVCIPLTLTGTHSPSPPLARSLGSLGSLVLLHPSPSSGAVPKIFIDFENVFMALRVSHKNIFYIYSL